tara:strand:- start:144 stop:374 length:231 start_codon:yes stop_codon:yes gene_type:complete
MLMSHEEQAKMHEEICMALETISSSSLQNIYRQLQQVEAKRMLIREIIIGLQKGFEMSALLIQIDTTISRDGEYEE